MYCVTNRGDIQLNWETGHPEVDNKLLLYVIYGSCCSIISLRVGTCWSELIRETDS